MRSGSRVAPLLVTLLAVVATSVVPGPGAFDPPSARAESVTTTRYVPLAPCRLVDTRFGTGFRPLDDTTMRIAADACGIPTDAVAVAATTTVVNAGENGFLVTYPAGTAPPDAATLAWRAGATRGNSATIPLGADRSIDLYRSDGFGAGDVTVDVVGAFVPAERSTAGRFVATPVGRRLLDTRDTSPVRAGSVTTIPRPPGVADDAIALAVTITAIRTSGRGFFTVYPSGADRPTAAALNVEAPGQFRSGSTLVAVDEGGFSIYTDIASDLTVDLTGYFTGDDAESSTDGLFVPVSPTRVTDTRPTPYPLYRGGSIELPVAAVTGRRAAAVAVNLTMIDPRVRGSITAHAARRDRGPVASGYALAHEIAGQFALTPVTPSGLAVFAESGTELTADVLGWFTGPPAAETRDAPAANPVPVQRVLALGDSSLAGIERTGATGALQGAAFDFRPRSCRRLVRTSCRGREGPIPPPTALDSIEGVAEDAYDVLVVMTGYNDTMPGFAGDVPTIVAAARSKGFRRIVWLTMAREFRSDKGGPDAYQVYAEHNRYIRANADEHDFMIAPEWSSIVRQVPWWTYTDGIHLDRPGGFGAADFISRVVAHVTGQRCPQPEAPGAPNDGICPDPGTRPPVDVQTLYAL